MNPNKTIFSPARIRLPGFSNDGERMERWAVIACDQFTSEPSYWGTCRKLIGDEPSAYRFVMPEAYLGTPDETEQSAVIAEAMDSYRSVLTRELTGMIGIRRTFPNGTIRRGLVGVLDLEQYDFSPDSVSAVRATEKTVMERIPPRCRVREKATVELPHILVLTKDPSVFDEMDRLWDACPVIYDFGLMLGGGHIEGRGMTGSALPGIVKAIADYEAANPGMTYAVGDGNHSLAAAKAHWDNLKKEGAAMSHPARYALCELTPLTDESLVFEPIYRILKNVDPAEVRSSLLNTAVRESAQKTELVIGGERLETVCLAPAHALTVGSLQDFLDRYLSEHPGAVCDYIHGKESLIGLTRETGTVGFLFEGMDKKELFPYVSLHGTLPRKTFSMGEAESKRYYLEAREIRG